MGDLKTLGSWHDTTPRKSMHTCSTSSPLQTTTVGYSVCELSSSSSARESCCSNERGTVNSKSQVHFSQRLSTQGTQQRAVSGDDGVVKTCGTR